MLDLTWGDFESNGTPVRAPRRIRGSYTTGQISSRLRRCNIHQFRASWWIWWTDYESAGNRRYYVEKKHKKKHRSDGAEPRILLGSDQVCQRKPVGSPASFPLWTRQVVIGPNSFRGGCPDEEWKTRVWRARGWSKENLRSDPVEGSNFSGPNAVTTRKSSKRSSGSGEEGMLLRAGEGARRTKTWRTRARNGAHSRCADLRNAE